MPGLMGAWRQEGNPEFEREFESEFEAEFGLEFEAEFEREFELEIEPEFEAEFKVELDFASVRTGGAPCVSSISWLSAWGKRHSAMGTLTAQCRDCLHPPADTLLPTP